MVVEEEEDNKDHTAGKGQVGRAQGGKGQVGKGQMGKGQVGKAADVLDNDDHQICEYFFWEDKVEEENKEDK